MGRPQLILLITLFSISCSEKRTYLTEEIKELIPYKSDQILVFESSESVINKLHIKEIRDNRFPDGLGAPSNERMTVTAWRLSRTVRDGTIEIIFSLAAQDGDNEEQMTFEITLKDTGMYRYSLTLSEFRNSKTQELQTKYQRFDDVMILELPPKVRNEKRTIKEVFWSKSAGYVRLVQNDGTIWDLKEINYR